MHGHPGERLGLAGGGVFFPQETFNPSLKMGVLNTANKVHERFGLSHLIMMIGMPLWSAVRKPSQDHLHKCVWKEKLSDKGFPDAKLPSWGGVLLIPLCGFRDQPHPHFSMAQTHTGFDHRPPAGLEHPRVFTSL